MAPASRTARSCSARLGASRCTGPGLSRARSRPSRSPKTVQDRGDLLAISKEADGWYGSCSCADVPTRPLPATGQETGRDVGRKVFRIPSDGAIVETPRQYRKSEEALKKAQRRVSRRKKGRHRRRTAVKLLAKAQQQVRRQRQGFRHKTALALVRQYDVIAHEAIHPAALGRRPAPKPGGTGSYERNYERNGASRKAGLTPSIRDAGWAGFLNILACKAAWAGKRVEAVNPADTSQDCSGCGARIQKSLSVRTHICPACGLILDRDEHAARTILWRGQRRRGLAGMPAGLNREPVGL